MTARPNLSGPWPPVDYTTGPSVRQAVDQLDTGRPVPNGMAMHDIHAREDVIHAAGIRAMLCASRGLSDSQGCHPPGCECGRAPTREDEMITLQSQARSSADALEAGRYTAGLSPLLRALADELDRSRADFAALAESLRLRQIEIDRLLLAVRGDAK